MQVKRPSNQERVIFGGPSINPNVNTPQQQGYGQQPTARK